MIDHVSIGVRDLAASARFYELILQPLGWIRQAEHATRVAFGSKYPELWLNARPAMVAVAADTGVHICLRARTTAAVDAFHAHAIAHGGVDDGAPGLRPATQVVYYAAFIRDPDGNRLEVMTVPTEVPTGEQQS
jgi:catechol 2,3-dioxygenase-like lactoylglutathione lyase family enzyme